MRGYENRNRGIQELLRLNAYFSKYAFRGNDKGERHTDLMHFPWDDDDPLDPPDSDDVKDIIAEIDAYNNSINGDK